MDTIMNRLKRTKRLDKAFALLLIAGSFLGVSAQSQDVESLIVSAKGSGVITKGNDKGKIKAALVVLRGNGTVMITVTTDLQLELQGSWKASTDSPEEVSLTITGGALEKDLEGSGKLILTSDRKSLKELAIKAKSKDGQEITVTFVADDADSP